VFLILKRIFFKRDDFTIKEYYFSLLKFFMIAYFYLIFYSYILNLYDFFLKSNLIHIVEQKIIVYLLFSFFITSLFIIIIRFSLLNVLVFVLSLIIEFLVNKNILVYYFYPLTYPLINKAEYNFFPIGLIIYLSYFVINLRKDKYNMLILFLINLIILSIINLLVIKLNPSFYLFFYLYLIVYPFIESKLIIIIKSFLTSLKIRN